MSAGLDSALAADLAAQVSGPVLRPADSGYDAARAVHNGLIDRRPAVIVRCRQASDVVAALALARREGLEVSVRGGGHNVAGRAVTNGGVMIDLAELSDEELRRWWDAQEPTDEGTSPLQDELADEIERRGLDV